MSVKWNIHLFAGLSERFGGAVITLELDQAELTVHQLKQELITRYPADSSLITISFMACNQAYASDEQLLLASDELALLPPVSGGEEAEQDVIEPSAAPASRYVVTEQPLSVEAITAMVIEPDNGAALTFTGTTREWTHGARTVRLEYEAYVPMAVKTLQQIGDEIEARWPGAKVAIAHRIGVVEIAEISVVIAVSAPHRGDCYEASRYAIERLKQIVPIWKREIWEDGSEWKGHQLGPWNPVTPL
ncbi:molybdenum cofactor biosynthesis protein [Paenibacillus lignilyticus]|uniref:Molybdenum cofactor biosynthesis protein MoaE n=1 Tax=Paenibacillus lignilyticus TaxID=1172615 RepID=A0ABS5C849_9BACL|nr:molybdenum cofactor biosynthesis protein MoaE [Paenibacillus lignilyticus]MBP3962152.1 molybdenum cofactor biosynthesis protein MoaE [Paenibacillus lignilyticus]